jgi:D-lactate dehydrogenase (cytochrome)
VTCKLYPLPGSVATALAGVESPAAAVELYGRARSVLGDGLVAFELVGRLPLQLVLEHIPGTREPMEPAHEWYVLMEYAPAGADAQLRVEDYLAQCLETDQIRDAILAQSEAQRAALWRLRHSIPEAEKLAGAGIKHDVSVPVSRVAQFIAEAGAEARALVPGARVIVFGHLGDGNVHFNIQQPPDADPEAFLGQWEAVAHSVHSMAHDLGGSFSAEHGIGRLKRDELRRLRGGVEYELMCTLKRALDPQGLMNPGKLLPPDA